MNDRLVFLVLVNCITIPDRNPHSISPSFYQFVRESSPIVIPGTSGSENIIESGHCILEQRVFGKTDVCSIPISGVALNDFEIFRSVPMCNRQDIGKSNHLPTKSFSAPSTGNPQSPSASEVPSPRQYQDSREQRP